MYTRELRAMDKLCGEGSLGKRPDAIGRHKRSPVLPTELFVVFDRPHCSSGAGRHINPGEDIYFMRYKEDSSQ
jgi:hypothetical protein